MVVQYLRALESEAALLGHSQVVGGGILAPE